MITRTHPQPPWLRRLGGWCVLAVYLVAASPVGLVLAGALAVLDNNHQVLLVPDAENTRLVLHHGPVSAFHDHGPIAQTLAALANQDYSTNPDHVILFPASPACLESEFSEFPGALPLASSGVLPTSRGARSLTFSQPVRVQAGSAALRLLSAQLLI